MKRIPELDGVRGIAVLMVMGFHCFQDNPLINSPALKTLGKFSVIGQTGVDLFFVLSGFLITRILLAAKPSDSYFRDFYIRRTLRIFPLYYGFLAFSYFLLPNLLGTSTPHIAQQSWFWLHLQNIPATFQFAQASGPGHFWSLAIEEHFYLFWPLAVYVFDAKRLFRFSITLCLLALVSRLLLIASGFSVFYFTFCRMDALAIGAIVALIEYRYGLQPFARQFKIATIALAVGLAAAWPFISGSHSNLGQLVKFPLIASLYAAAIGWLATVNASAIAGRFLRGWPLVSIGKISYGMYVFHPICFYFCFQRTAFNFWLAAPLAFAATFIVSALSFRLYETPFLRLKDRFTPVQHRERTKPPGDRLPLGHLQFPSPSPSPRSDRPVPTD